MAFKNILVLTFDRSLLLWLTQCHHLRFEGRIKLGERKRKRILKSRRVLVKGSLGPGRQLSMGRGLPPSLRACLSPIPGVQLVEGENCFSQIIF